MNDWTYSLLLIIFCIQKAWMYLLLLSLPGHVTLLDVPVAQEVSEVAKDGEDAVAHVGEHSHQ